MKKSLLPVFLSLFLTASLSAQNLKVEVFSGSEPLGHAYIFINSEVFGAADEAGVTNIPQARLNIGDTISASFVGMQGGGVVYDDAMRRAAACRLDLQSLYRIEDITVSAKGEDPYKLYRKYIRRQYPAWYARLYESWWQPMKRLDFSFNYEQLDKNDNSIKNSEGNMSMFFYHLPEDTVDITPIRHRLLDFDAAGDTTGVAIKVKSDLYRIYVTAAVIYYADNQSHRRWTALRYMGEDGPYRVFTLASRDESLQVIRGIYSSMLNGTYQTLVKVDKKSKDIRHIEGLSIRNGHYIRTTADYVRGKNGMLLTRADAHTIDFETNTETKLDIRDMVITPYQEQPPSDAGDAGNTRRRR